MSFMNGYRSQKMPDLLFCIHSSEFKNTPEDSPESEARVVVPGRSETPGQLPAAAEDGEGDQITEAGQNEQLSCSAQSLFISLSLQKQERASGQRN